MASPAKLGTPPEKVTVESTSVACDGGAGPLGHPRVYLTMGAGDSVECPYCDRLYVLKPGSPRAGH